jgi:hypothetical protein
MSEKTKLDEALIKRGLKMKIGTNRSNGYRKKKINDSIKARCECKGGLELGLTEWE